MAEIPLISITLEDDEVEDMAESSNRNINECHTDIEEDFDGSEIERKVRRSSLKISAREDDGATDVEDCFDSGEEEEIPVKETEISLNEFLDQGCVNESSNNDPTKEDNENMLKTYSSFKSPSPTAFNLNIPQAPEGLTDFEEMTSSGDEIEEKHFSEDDKPIILEDSQGTDIQDALSSHRKLAAANRMNRHESNSDSESGNDSRKHNTPCSRPKKLSVKLTRKTANIEDAKSDVENMFFDDDIKTSCERGNKKTKKRFPVLETPDIEIMAFDGGSDIDDNTETKNPEINILFHSHKKTTKSVRKSAVKSSSLLKLPKHSEDALTDIENLNSSDDEENFKIETKNIIPIALVKSDALTDVEDMEDGSDEEEDFDEKPEIALPSPLREMTVFRENENGEPNQETSALPESFLLSVNNLDFDKGLTDIEDFSDDDEIDTESDTPDDFEMKNYLDCDSGFVQSSDHAAEMGEGSRSPSPSPSPSSYQSCKIGRDKNDRKTSSELRRRRKTKQAPSHTKSNFLDTKFYVDLNASDAHTDVEDFNVDNNNEA